MHLTSHPGNEIICVGIDAVDEVLAEVAAPALRKQGADQERQRAEELERELEDLKAQGAACAEAIVGAEATLTSFDSKELEKLGLTVPDEISNAGIVLTETLEALRAIEPGIVDRARQSERQRLKEALTETGLMFQKWAREKRRQAKDAVGPEKLKDEWVAKGYDNAADALFVALATQEADRG